MTDVRRTVGRARDLFVAQLRFHQLDIHQHRQTVERHWCQFSPTSGAGRYLRSQARLSLTS